MVNSVLSMFSSGRRSSNALRGGFGRIARRPVGAISIPSDGTPQHRSEASALRHRRSHQGRCPRLVSVPSVTPIVATNTTTNNTTNNTIITIKTINTSTTIRTPHVTEAIATGGIPQ